MSKSTYSLKLPASAKKAAAELGRVSGYFVSAREYEELQRLRTFERRVHGITDLLPEIAEVVQGAKMNTAHDHLNALLDESQDGNSGRRDSQHMAVFPEPEVGLVVSHFYLD